MRLLRLLAALFISLALPAPVPAADSDWRLVWEDNFDRAEVGDGWKVGKGASIVDGRMRMVGTVWAMTTRSFEADVRLEFDAWALDGIAPCDLSATLGSGEQIGWGYLLGFGAQGNHANHIRGPGVNWEDKNPPFLIEHGKKYHLVAQKEGKRITYTVNGTTIIDRTTDDPVGGPGFDRVGVLTWTGMDVDNVRVYERVTRHPDTPVILTSLPEGPLYRDGRKLVIRGAASPEVGSAVDAFNAGKLEEALKQFRSMGGTLVGLLGQAYVLGDLAYVEPFRNPEFERLAGEFASAAKAHPEDKILADYAAAADWFGRFKMQRDRAAYAAAIRFKAMGPANNPFYHKARLYGARYHYWNGKEGGNQAVCAEAVSWMSELRDIWPENTVLRQYAGDKVPWGEELIADTDRHPAWAAYLREAYARSIALMQRFFDERQTPDGQLGGGYGDDVELLRTWHQIAAISTAAEPVRRGIECLAEGVWDNVLIDGFDKHMSDVEHSAEPSADALPGMLLLRYGDPLWVERNLTSCKHIKQHYMAIDKKGYPRFLSSTFGGKQYEKTTMGGGDTGYCARAMKHFLWAAWHGNAEAKDWFVRWAEGWRVATMASIDGKLAGVVPYTLWYPDGGILPPVKGKTWHDKDLNYWPRTDMIHDAFLAAHYLSSERRFLQPFQVAMEFAAAPPTRDEYPEGSPEWQLAGYGHFPNPMSTEQHRLGVYRWMTGENVYDEYLNRRSADPAVIYRVDSDLDAYLKTLEKAARSGRHNLELQTTEVLSTDRAALPSALAVFGAYTGAITGMRDAAIPTFSVTYDTPSTDFAALVVTATTERLRVWLYNFDERPMPVGLQLWRLRPGTYILTQGQQVPDESGGPNRYLWEPSRTVSILHRADGPTVTVPPGKVWAVDLRLDEPARVPAAAPDLAIGAGDVVLTRDGVGVTVHNIGNASAGAFTVALQRIDSGKWKTLAQSQVSSLPTPKDMSPSVASVTLKIASASLSGECRVIIDPTDSLYELCEANNTREIKRD